MISDISKAESKVAQVLASRIYIYILQGIFRFTQIFINVLPLNPSDQMSLNEVNYQKVLADHDSFPPDLDIIVQTSDTSCSIMRYKWENLQILNFQYQLLEIHVFSSEGKNLAVTGFFFPSPAPISVQGFKGPMTSGSSSTTPTPRPFRR